MPEAEFEMYLNVLSRLMRLSPQQRSAVADELRDHLEARLAELVAAGHSREEAVRLALDDLGDTAALANDFRNVANLKRRKKIMRYSLGTVAALVAVLFVVSAFWPVTRELSPVSLVAQNQSQPKPLDASKARRVESPSKPESIPQKATPADVRQTPTLEQRLDSKMSFGVQCKATKFDEEIRWLRDMAGIDVWIDPKNDGDYSSDFPVSLDLPAKKYTLREILDLLVEQSPNPYLGYRVRGELLMITNKQDVQVYDVRDLIATFPESAKLSTPFIQTPPKNPGGGFGDGSQIVTMGGNKITDVIVQIVKPDTWIDNGGSGTIREFNGLLTVNQTPRVHSELRELLKLMRKRMAERGDSKASS